MPTRLNGYRTLNALLAAALVGVLAAVSLCRADALGLAVCGVRLPETCMYKLLLGRTCPGCGTLRSTVLALQGRWAESWAMHPAGLGLAAYLVLQALWRIRLAWARQTSAHVRHADGIWSGVVLAGVLLAGLVLRALCGAFQAGAPAV